MGGFQNTVTADDVDVGEADWPDREFEQMEDASKTVVFTLSRNGATFGENVSVEIGQEEIQKTLTGKGESVSFFASVHECSNFPWVPVILVVAAVVILLVIACLCCL